MNRTDLRTLCTALGFTAVVMQGGMGGDAAQQALRLALLIEEFCRMHAQEICLAEGASREAQ